MRWSLEHVWQPWRSRDAAPTKKDLLGLRQPGSFLSKTISSRDMNFVGIEIRIRSTAREASPNHMVAPAGTPSSVKALDSSPASALVSVIATS